MKKTPVLIWSMIATSSCVSFGSIVMIGKSANPTICSKYLYRFQALVQTLSGISLMNLMSNLSAICIPKAYSKTLYRQN